MMKSRSVAATAAAAGVWGQENVLSMIWTTAIFLLSKSLDWPTCRSTAESEPLVVFDRSKEKTVDLSSRPTKLFLDLFD